MNPADETAAKIEPTERQLAGVVPGSIDKLDEQLRVSVEALLHPSPPPKPVEEVDDLLLAISRHLDDEASERKAIVLRPAASQDLCQRRLRRLEELRSLGVPRCGTFYLDITYRRAWP
jgi:hypothetical protein